VNPSPLSAVVPAWVAAVRDGLTAKSQRFGPDAAEGMRFYSSNAGDYYGEVQQERYFRVRGSRSRTVVQVNKAAELVQLFGPVLYHKNPVRTVIPRKAMMPPPELYGPPVPQVQQAYMADLEAVKQAYTLDSFKGDLFSAVLNWNTVGGNLKAHADPWITEALIKGAGCLWVDVAKTPGSDRQEVRSVWDSVDNLVLDPWAQSIEQCRWIARRVVRPCEQVEAERGLPPGTIRPGAGHAAEGRWDKPNPYQDLFLGPPGHCVYWQVWSKMGVGGRLPRVAKGRDDAVYYELFGDYCYLEICEACPYPMNVPPGTTDGEYGTQRAAWAMQWPVPTWMDRAWPMTPLFFHVKPGDVWPVSHLSAAMGELKFLNWAFGKMADKIEVTSRDIIAYATSIDEQVSQAITNGDDLAVVKFGDTGSKPLSELIQFVQHPQWNKDFWQVIEAVSNQFDRRTGLTELLYGQSAVQLRSAAEARVKSDQLAVRPDDMANRVEDAMTQAARNELIAVRWHLSGRDVAPIVGPVAARWWDLVLAQTDPLDAFLSFDCRVEAGSARKPNHEGEQAALRDAMQNLFQPLYQYAQQTGVVDPVNALVADWAKANDIRNPERYALRAPPPPEPAPGGPPPQQGPPK
jgi:hypothetical protein